MRPARRFLSIKAPLSGHTNLFVGTLSPSRMVKYIYDNQYPWLLLPKQVPRSLFYYLFNQRFCQSHYRSTIDHVISACCRTSDVNACPKIWFSHYCTDEIETICMILYKQIFKGIPWELCVKVCWHLIQYWSYNKLEQTFDQNYSRWRDATLSIMCLQVCDVLLISLVPPKHSYWILW